MLFKSYIPGNDTFVFILNLDISRPVLHSTFDIQMGKIDIDNMSSVYIYLPLPDTITLLSNTELTQYYIRTWSLDYHHTGER